MPKVDNDDTKKVAKPFIVIAQKRAGGTMLTHLLSSHPEIFCDRGETMHQLSIWRKHAKRIDVGLLTYILGHQEGYRASGFRCVYIQAMNVGVWNQLRKFDFKIIHLTRTNKIRQAASHAIQRMIRMKRIDEYYPVHTFDSLQGNPPPRVEVPPWVLLKYAREFVQQDKGMCENLARDRFEVLPLSYTDLVEFEGNFANKMPLMTQKNVCNYLKVSQHAMVHNLQKITAIPLRMLFKNWSSIEEAVEKSEFADCLADEEGWIFRDGYWRKI